MITIRRTTVVAVLLACAAAIPLVSIAPAGSQETKQRVSFLGIFNTLTGTGAWELIPRTPGPLKRDSGTLSGDGAIALTSILDGQRVNAITGSDRMTGKRGTLVLSQKLVSTDVGSRYSADVGTWKLVSGTGTYKSLTGGGRFAAVGLPGGTLLSSQEGWLTIR